LPAADWLRRVDPADRTIMPSISVVIASVNGLPSIHECLTALHQQEGGVDGEIVVADCCRDGTAEHIRKHFPKVKLLHFEERLGIPELRAIGMEHSTGKIITVTEDHCMAPPNWFAEILQAHQGPYPAVGGTVLNGSTERITDWAVYLCEYSHVMPPIPAGEVGGIPGNNASYKREILFRVDDRVRRNCWEYFLHEELKKAGVKFLSVPGIVVNHKKEFGFWYFMSQRYHYSRSFAGMRRARTTPARRLFYLACSPLLPVLMSWRIASKVWEKQRHRRELILSLPLLGLFMVSYAAGEFVGYLAGGGNSLSKVE
jgi:GT2 family glycosyltransferase